MRKRERGHEAKTTANLITKADGNRREATSDAAGEICGEAAMVSRQIVVNIDQDSTVTSKGNEGYVADEEAWFKLLGLRNRCQAMFYFYFRIIDKA